MVVKVEETDRELVNRLAKICGGGLDVIEIGLKCVSFGDLLVHVFPVHMSMDYGKSAGGDSLVLTERVMLASPVFPLLPVYLVQWKGARSPVGFVHFSVVEGRNVLAACRYTRRLFASQKVSRRGYGCVGGLCIAGSVLLYALSGTPITSCEGLGGGVPGVNAGLLYAGYRGVGVVTLVPFAALRRGRSIAYYAVDLWRRRVEELASPQVEEAGMLEGAEAVGGAALLAMMPSPRGFSLRLVPVAYAEYGSATGVWAPIAMAVFAAEARRESLRRVASVLGRGSSVFEKLKEVAHMLAYDRTGYVDGAFCEELVRLAGLEAPIEVRADRVLVEAAALVEAMGVGLEGSPVNALVECAVAEAARALGCRDVGGGVYRCPLVDTVLLRGVCRSLHESGEKVQSTLLARLLSTSFELAGLYWEDTLRALEGVL